MNAQYPPLPSGRPVAVYTDMDVVRELLTDPRFKVLPSMPNAQVIWTKHPIKHFK